MIRANFILLMTSLIVLPPAYADLTCKLVKINDDVEVLNSTFKKVKRVHGQTNAYKSGDYTISLEFYLDTARLDSNFKKQFAFKVDTLEAEIKNTKTGEEFYITNTVRAGAPLFGSIQVDDSTGKENSLELTCIVSKDLLSPL